MRLFVERFFSPLQPAQDPSHGPSHRRIRSRSRAAKRLVLGLFTAAVFLSALLLFGVQPMFSRAWSCRSSAAHPRSGPCAMVFFQSMLLAGYAYAHFLMARKNRRLAVARAPCAPLTGALIHAAAVDCRLGRASGIRNAPLAAGPRSPFRSGCHFFALAANNPLLRTWFAAYRRTAKLTTPIFSTPLPTSAVFSRFSPILCCSSRHSRCIRKAGCGARGLRAARRADRGAAARSCCDPARMQPSDTRSTRWRKTGLAA